MFHLFLFTLFGVPCRCNYRESGEFILLTHTASLFAPRGLAFVICIHKLINMFLFRGLWESTGTNLVPPQKCVIVEQIECHINVVRRMIAPCFVQNRPGQLFIFKTRLDAVLMPT